jgi:RNA polymerase sigma-B factor
MTPQWHARADDTSACDLSALFSRCSAGDRRAREKIILRFLPYARRLARIYDWRGEPIEDLCQAASVGLIKAVDRYSPEPGDGFLAYARPMILGEIRRHFRDTTWRVHVPRTVRQRAGAVLLAENEVRAATRSAKPEAIANYLGIGREELTETRRALAADSPRSLDASYMASDGHALPLGEVIGADELGYARVELSIGIRQALLTLKPRDQKVLLFRLAWEMSQDEIAGLVGLSQMHVSRILRKAGAALTASCGLAISGPRKSRAWSSPRMIGTAGLEPAISRV